MLAATFSWCARRDGRCRRPGRGIGDLLAPARGAEGWEALTGVMGNLGGGRAGWPVELSLARAWHEPLLDAAGEDATVRLADILQLEQIAAGYPSREKFLTELTLDPPDATSDQAGVPSLDENYLILSTIHSADTSEQIQRLLADHSITCSMSRSGNVWENAAMDSFFSSLKTERTTRKVYRTREDAKADVFYLK